MSDPHAEPVMPAAQPRFSLGQVFATPGAHTFMFAHGISIARLLRRHQYGDWGDVCDEDARANEAALRYGSRLLSVYRSEGGTLWIITEADRSVTTALLPDEY